MTYLRRWARAYVTAHRLRLLLLYGWCPACNSSPPAPACDVCLGNSRYGPRLLDAERPAWAARYVALRHPRGRA